MTVSADLFRCPNRLAAKVLTWSSNRGALLDGVSKRSSVVSNPRISRDDGHQRWRLAEQFCGCQMHRVERANRLNGKGAANTREHGVGDRDDEATTREDS